MMWWNGDWNWGAWLVMTAVMVAFWAALIWLVVYAIRSSDEPSTRRPEHILDERFARGEITEDEYRDGIAVLRETRPKAGAA